MFIEIDQMGQMPIYQQLRNQVVAAIASGQLSPGDGLPSVRSLAGDLGINLHTVNKAYALLRDEGYVLMRGRAGAVVAEPPGGGADEKRLLDGLLLLAREHKAAGGTREEFRASVARALDETYGAGGAVPGADPAAREGQDA